MALTPVKLIIPVIEHLATFPHVRGILLVPLWRASNFFTYLFHGVYLGELVEGIGVWRYIVGICRSY